MPLIRPSLDTDLSAITAIYAHHVTHGRGSFELTPPDTAEMARRRQDVLDKGWPFLVAEENGQVQAYAYANHFRPRPAYRFSVENSVYVTPDLPRKGLGRALMAELMRLCELAGARQMIAVIGDSANHGSIGLHTSLGFQPVGVFKSSGWKHDRWLDTVFMQRSLGLGDQQAPISTASD